MTAMDFQMQIWRSNLEIWRRMFEMQVAVSKGLMDASSAWTWQSVRLAGDAVQAEREVVEQTAEAATKVAREAEVDVGEATQRIADGATEAARRTSDKTAETAKAAADEVAGAAADAGETASKTARSAEKAAEKPAEEAKKAAEDKPAASRRGRSAAARSSTSKSTSKRSSSPRSRGSNPGKGKAKS